MRIIVQWYELRIYMSGSIADCVQIILFCPYALALWMASALHLCPYTEKQSKHVEHGCLELQERAA